MLFDSGHPYFWNLTPLSLLISNHDEKDLSLFCSKETMLEEHVTDLEEKYFAEHANMFPVTGQC